MQEAFERHISENDLLKKGERVLLAVSGGMDSMVMVELFRKSGYSFDLAHCNFLLRAQDSDADEAFVKASAQQLKRQFFCERFQTVSYAAEHGISVQMAARTLRYQWLESIRKEQGYDAIATAHHLDDAIETLFINLARGTGISGLTGIPLKTNHVIRPLLFASRKDIEDYANDHGVEFREDLSNKELKYTRNKIRHQVIGVLNEINPGFSGTMQSFFERMEALETIYRMTTEAKKQASVKQLGEEVHVSIQALSKLPVPHVFLHEFLKEYGFTQNVCRQMIVCMHGRPGKTFSSETHMAVKDREVFIVFPIKTNPEIANVEVNKNTREVQLGQQRFICESGPMDDQISLPDGPETLLADFDRLRFPLVIRPWQPGDKMVPLGMSGQKKISDILTEEKIPLHRKQQVLVLISAGQIAWLPGIRADNRFKITKQTKNYFQMQII